MKDGGETEKDGFSIFTKSTAQQKGKNNLKKCKRTNRLQQKRSKQRMQMTMESIAKMIAAITIIISMCCWHQVGSLSRIPSSC